MSDYGEMRKRAELIPLDKDWYMTQRSPAKKAVRFVATASIPELEKAPPFMSVRHVAEFMGVSRDVVMGLIKCKALVAHRFGRAYRITRTNLAAYLLNSKGA